MARIKGKRPPKYQQAGDYPKTCFLSFERIKDIPLSSTVAVRMPSGETVSGALISHSDYLVGCPVVDLGLRRLIAIGYEGEIVGIERGV